MLRTVQIQTYIASVVESVMSSFPAICKALHKIAWGDIKITRERLLPKLMDFWQP